MLVSSIFTFSYTISYPIKDRNHQMSNIYSDSPTYLSSGDWKAFQVQKVVSWVDCDSEVILVDEWDPQVQQAGFEFD